MPHPRNRRERFLIGKRKGEKRAAGETAGYSWSGYTEEKKQESLRKWAFLRRSTTKLCSCEMCGNPRHSRWSTKNDRLTLQEKKFAIRRPLEEL